jgi:hypothetical protein
VKPPRRAIVQVCWGPLAGVKAVVAPGERLTVGRGAAATLQLANDEAMAPLQFEVAWDGRRARARHLGGAPLTLLSGQVLDDAEVGHGQWLRAGSTDFTVHVEAHTPASTPRDAATQAAAERALEALRAVGRPLLAVVDAARDPRIGELLRESVDPCCSLYDGTEGARLAAVAPHLVALAADSRLLDDLVREGWGLRWAIWLTSARPLLEVRRHLRKVLLVQREGTAEPTYFRFYDPDVLRVYLETCTPDERAQWFGDVVTSHLGEDPGAETGWWRLDAPRH